MTDIQMDRMIAALEQTNRERIRLLSSQEMADGLRLQRMKKELRSANLKMLWNHFAIRCFRGKIHTKGAQYNLEPFTEKRLARQGSKELRVAIYTCVTGGYDMPMAPFFAFDTCDYFLFCEQEADGWTRQAIPEKLSKMNDLAWVNRYIKLHPFEFFADEYDYAIYLDGNITPVSDLSVWASLVDPKVGLAFHRHCSRCSLKEELTACRNLKKGNPDHLRRQLASYRAQGMPDDYGLLEGNVIVTDLKSSTARRLTDQCWREFVKRAGGRDQLVWPYIFWKSQIPMERVCTLGNNVWRNSKLFISSHAQTES